VGLDPVVVERRMTKILEEIEFLKTVKLQKLDEFIEDGKSLRSTAKAIETIVQSIIDISSHIVAQNHWGVTDTYRNTIALLATHKIIADNLSSNLQQVVAMRNILIHQYLDIDFHIIWNSIENLSEDASEFIKAINRYLKNHD